MKPLFRFADNRIDDSLANRLRRRRFALFASLSRALPAPVRILDVGGEEEFWRRMGFLDRAGTEITLVNTKPLETSAPGVRAELGDARDLRFADGEFDVVFSNSVIEHVGDWEDQVRMAEEVRRVGRRHFVQTPNRRFPIEPHFLFPGFQFLPLEARVRLVQRFALGYHRALPDRADALRAVSSIRLLDRREVAALFPGSRIYEERLLGLVKSYVAYGGWD